MSVAVSPYLPHSQTLGFAGGHQADLLDALLASCQKPSMNPKLPGYGRILQPYFAIETPSKVPVSNGKQMKGKSRSKKSKGKANYSSASGSSDEEVTMPKSAPVDSQKEQTIKAVYCSQRTSGSVWAGPTFGMAPSVLEIPLPSDFLLH